MPSLPAPAPAAGADTHADTHAGAGTGAGGAQGAVQTDEQGPVARARRLADGVLRPQAERADVEGVRREVVDEVAAAGLLGLGGPREAGGGGAPPAVQREVTELLAGADGATWFVTVQHGTPLQTVARGSAPRRAELLPALCSGERLAGIALAHVRRPGPPAVRAVRTPTGFRFDGAVGWATGWGLADVVMLAGLTDGDELVLVLVPGHDQPGLHAGAPLPLSVMAGTATVQLVVDGLQVEDRDVLSVEPAAAWREADRLRTANASPAVFGLLREVVRRLRDSAERRGEPGSARAADRLEEQAEAVRSAAYALLDQVPPHEQVDERLRLRGRALALAVRGSAALVAATGGSALTLGAAPQRLAREALFHQVQAQTPPVRAATLEALLGPEGRAERA